ncbi:hypothetical protein ACW5CM_07635 [Microbacterium sp. A588]
MTEPDAVADRSSLVPGVHRVIRVVDGKEGPFAGQLVTGDDGVAVCVDAEVLTDWDGWAFSDAEHVCGVIDVRRRINGHDALLPWCTQRVEAFLGRRMVAEAPLTAGELGTLVVSLLRGMRELGNAAADATGEWWLTGDGRPLFVLGAGGVARAASAALTDRVAEHSADRATTRVLEEIATSLRQPRHHIDDDHRWEEQLFAMAAPRALRLDVFAPERVVDVGVRRLPRVPVEHPGSRHSRSETRRARSEDRPRGVVSAVVRTIGQQVHAAIERFGPADDRVKGARVGAVTAADPRQAPTKSRKRPLILAGSLAAMVLAVGLMWPSGEKPDDANAMVPIATSTPPAAGESPASSEASPPEAETAPPAEGPPTEAPPAEAPPNSEKPPNDAGAVAAVPALLDEIRECVDAAADSCPSATAEGTVVPTDGIASLGSTASTAALVDDYGDVAVVRLTPVEEGDQLEQMLVLERRNESWLVRDVYDVAHQPA